MEVSLFRAAELIQAANEIVITAHISPDGDSLGSMLALYQCLTSQGKKVAMLLDDDVPSVYHFLPYHQEIKRIGDSKLKVDLIIALDASDKERIGQVGTMVAAPILNIDHHISNTKYADFWFVDSSAAATGEILMQLLPLLNAEISPDMAICLYTAIATDCGFFRYANTTAATLRYAAELMERGAQPHVISEYMETKPLASIKVLTEVLETLELYENGQIASVTISADIMREHGENTEGFINYPRNIEGVEVAIMFKYADENSTRVSLRSRTVDVSKLALSFGGGGHARAAGCTINSGLKQAKEQVIASTIKLIKEGR